MQLKKLLSDDRAVSPVIGVILMVAITVILAAVIGTFVLGLGDSVQQTSPNANFAFDFNKHEGEWKNEASIDVTHEGGDTIDAERLTIIAGSESFSADEDDFDGWDGSVGAGDTQTVDHTAGSDWGEGDSVRVVWETEDGSSSQTLANRQIP